MRTVLPSVAVVCAAGLLGLSPPRVLATDLTPGASSPPAAAAQTRPAGQDAPTGRDTARGQNESGADEHRAQDRTRQEAPRSRGASEPARRPLDLSTPPVNHVMTREQVQALIEQPDDDETDEVMVQQGRYQAPVPHGQIRALAWALMHPLQAWRIFTPVTDE